MTFQTTGSHRSHIGILGEDATAAVRHGDTCHGGFTPLPSIDARRRYDRHSCW